MDLGLIPKNWTVEKCSSAQVKGAELHFSTVQFLGIRPQLLYQCINLSSQLWSSAAAHSNLASTEWCRACLLWKMARKDEAKTIVKHALYEAELAQQYPDAPQESFITGAEIICVQLKFEAGDNPDVNRLRADAKWENVDQWLEQAVYRGYSRPVTIQKLLEDCPPLKYLDDLGGELHERMAQSVGPK